MLVLVYGYKCNNTIGRPVKQTKRVKVGSPVYAATLDVDWDGRRSRNIVFLESLSPHLCCAHRLNEGSGSRYAGARS